MAKASYLSTLTKGAFSAPQQAALAQVFEYLCGNLRLGRCTSGTRAENFQMYALEGETASVADTEFSVAHGLGVAPFLVLPVLSLEEGAQLVPLTVTRAPDAERIYLSSSVTSAPFRVLVEG